MREFVISKIKIGDNSEPLVIPEIGINHNGKLSVAMQMVDAAADAGARIVKHQTHVIHDEMSGAAREVIPGNSDKSIYQIMQEAALSFEEEYELKKYVEEKGLVFLSTPFSRAAADRLEKMDVQAYKIGSGELNNYPLLEHVANFGKPMIVSTGMNSLQSVKKAVEILEKKNVQYALLHTTNLYPTPPHLVRLGAMQELMREFPNVIIGLSDHTVNNNSSLAAIALGAKIVERHFTDSKRRKGPDIICSMNKKELSQLIKMSKEVTQMLGGEKLPLKEEQPTINFAFATVVTIKGIKKGELFTKENLWVKRPGVGEILAEQYNELLGKRAACDIANDSHVSYKMIEKE